MPVIKVYTPESEEMSIDCSDQTSVESILIYVAGRLGVDRKILFITDNDKTVEELYDRNLPTYYKDLFMCVI